MRHCRRDISCNLLWVTRRAGMKRPYGQSCRYQQNQSNERAFPTHTRASIRLIIPGTPRVTRAVPLEISKNHTSQCKCKIVAEGYGTSIEAIDESTSGGSLMCKKNSGSERCSDK